jgi:hypothetical protein
MQFRVGPGRPGQWHLPRIMCRRRLNPEHLATVEI